MRIGWHLDGMTWDRYTRLTWVERKILHSELDDIITRSDGEPRPKDQR